jgi:hypothetical protein
VNVPMIVLGGAGIIIGGICLGVLVVLKIADDCAKRAAGWT